MGTVNSRDLFHSAMPSGPTHRALSRSFGVKDSSEVDRLLDSTVHQHGPSHRSDPIHSLKGVALALALRGKLTQEAMMGAAVHLAADSAVTNAMKRTGLKGSRRRAVQMLFEEQLQRNADRRRP